MGMQQVQQKSSKWSKRVRIILFVCALLILITGAVIWVLNSLNSTPALLATLFGAAAVIIAFIQLIPILFPAKTPDPVNPPITVNTPVTVNNVVPAPPINIYNVIPPSPAASPPQSQPASTPTETVSPPASSFANPLSLRTLPLTVGAKHIQRREKNVKEVYAQLIDPEVSTVALCGIGGVGKSTLAALVYAYVKQESKAAREPFKGEPVLLRINENTSFLELAANIFACVGKSISSDFSSLPPQAQAYALFNALNIPASAETPRLVILDQFENFLDLQTGRPLTKHVGIGELLDALNSQPCASRVLLTSRPRPHGARDDAPAALHIYQVSDLSTAEGVALLRGLGVAGEEDELRKAVERCNGHALSLTLLGTLLQLYTVNLATLLKDAAYTQLWEGRIEENLLKSIFSNLPAPSRSLLCAFSVYREAVPVEAVLVVLTGVTKRQALVTLGSLLEQHLIQVLPATGHYLLHPIVALYASHHFALIGAVDGESARKTAHAQAAQYYLQVAAANNATPGGVKGISHAQPLIEAVWQLCQAEQFQKAFELMDREDLFAKMSLWGANTVLLERCQMLLSGNWAYTPQQKAFLSSYIAGISSVLGRKQEALRNYEQALRIYRDVGNRKGEGTILHNLGYVYDIFGQKQEALGYYQQALRIRREMGDRRGEGPTLTGLGIVYNALGQMEEALKYHEQALRIRREVGDRRGEGTTLNNLGGVYNHLGQKQEALGYYEQALRIMKEVGDRGGEGTTLNNLGGMYNTLGQKQEALRYYEQALRIRKEVGDRRGEGTTLWNIGAACFDVGRNDAALACLLQAKQIFEQMQSPKVDDVAGWIEDLRKRVGEKQLEALRVQVEREGAEEIVERTLREMVNEQG
jgi:tetratricopeptide (TPR) repeat protein